MNKTGKVKTIVRAFTGKPDVDEDVLKFRREICGGCEFNSNNIPDSELGFIEKARKKLILGEPFCTACGCQINEKTGQSTEECGLAEKGETPKWHRIKLETTGRFELNIINESKELINLDLSENGTEFEINFGENKREGTLDISFIVESNLGVPLVLDYARPSCGICTKVDTGKISNNQYRIELTLDLTKISVGAFRKSLHLGYYLKSNYHKQTLKLVGTLKD